MGVTRIDSRTFYILFNYNNGFMMDIPGHTKKQQETELNTRHRVGTENKTRGLEKITIHEIKHACVCYTCKYVYSLFAGSTDHYPLPGILVAY